jgi:hypothetical protein
VLRDVLNNAENTRLMAVIDVSLRTYCGNAGGRAHAIQWVAMEEPTIFAMHETVAGACKFAAQAYE